jgi:hypothetical protein
MAKLRRHASVLASMDLAEITYTVKDETPPITLTETEASACYVLPPISMVQMLNIFSEVVFAETLPNPTLVRLEHVKYRAVM